MIWKILADTYLRESWRYGENTMELVESLFFYDSRLVVKMIECTRTLEHTERWKFAITTIDHLLDDFGLTLSDKSDLISNLSTRYLNMYSKPAELSLKLDAKFRIERNYVNYYINLKDNDTTLSDSLLKYLDQRSSAIKPVFEQLRKLEFSSLLSIQLNSLMGDLIHLSINRIFTSKQIKYELVLLYFLSAYYSSLLAQRKYNAVNSGLK
jgi:thiopeptide-type bacteriocin biosynthesis protein